MSFNELKKIMQDVLVPAGDGVYTVHAGANKKTLVQTKLYGTDVRNSWIKSFDQIPMANIPLILGVCSDNGGGILRGANFGPLFIRETLLQSVYKYTPYLDLGDVRVIPHLLRDEELNETTIKKCKEALYKNSSAPYPVAPLSLTNYFLNEFYKVFPHKRVLTLGGDHSISYASVGSFLKLKKAQNKKVGLIHFDAHTDLLESRLGVDVCFGSWTYHVLKELTDTQNLVQLGIRASGQPKEHWEKKYKIKQYWSSDFKQDGPQKIAAAVIEHYKKQQIDEIYVTLDIDVFDESFVTATGTPEANGLFPHDVMFILSELLEAFPITGADLVEVAPYTKGSSTTHNIEPESTLMIAQSFVEFLLGALTQSMQ